MALIDDLMTGKKTWDQATGEVSDPEPKPPPLLPVAGPAPGPATGSDYARAALASESARIAALGQGTRNNDLNVSAVRMGQFIGAGLIDQETVIAELSAAARTAGLPPREIATVLRTDGTGGLAVGMASPRHVEPAQQLTAGQWADVSADQIMPTDKPAERTSWWPLPLPEMGARADQQPAPTHLIRDDGQALLYSGRVNGLIGESESGKSWIALLAIVQAINDQQHILMIDFEDSPASIHHRMQQLGLTDEQLAYFDYANPDEAFGVSQSADLREALGQNYSVIVVDGVNAAMTLLGWDLNSNTDATLFSTGILRPLAKSGACVITVDHVPKNVEQRGKGGIGAQAKRAMTDGCAITVEVAEPFGKGQSGKLKLTVDKDRHGYVRGLAKDSSHIGNVLLESIDDNVRIHIQRPAAEENEKEWEPTVKMAAIVKTLEDMGTELTFTQIKQLVTGREETLRQAVAALIRQGRITARPGAKRAILHSLTAPPAPATAADQQPPEPV